MSRGQKERFAVYAVRDRGQDEKAWWTRIGTAFENNDGSLSVIFEALPVDGRCQIRKEQDRRERDDGRGGRDDYRGGRR